MRYWPSSTEKENRGGTKKKSKKATLQNAEIIAAFLPNVIATKKVLSKNTITILANSTTPIAGVQINVKADEMATAIKPEIIGRVSLLNLVAFISTQPF
jgi:hypothetical protein